MKVVISCQLSNYPNVPEIAVVSTAQTKILQKMSPQKGPNHPEKYDIVTW